MKAVVTGATGFIGRTTVRALVGAGHEVTCLVRETSNRAPLEGLGVSFAVGDVLDPESMQAPIAEADAVFHLAALLKVPWRADFMDANETGARNVAAACAAAPKPPVLVVVSSLAAAGVQPGDAPRDERDEPAPVSRYGRAKLAAEHAAAAFAGRVPTSIVRPPMVFGEGDEGVLHLFRMAVRGWFVAPTCKRDTRVSMVAVDELAKLLILVAEKGERLDPSEAIHHTGVYFAAADETPDFSEFAHLLAEATQSRAPTLLRAPKVVTFVAGAMSEFAARAGGRAAALNIDKAREATAGSWVCSAGKAKALGFEHRPLAAALAETGAWYRSEGWL